MNTDYARIRPFFRLLFGLSPMNAYLSVFMAPQVRPEVCHRYAQIETPLGDHRLVIRITGQLSYGRSILNMFNDLMATESASQGRRPLISHLRTWWVWHFSDILLIVMNVELFILSSWLHTLSDNMFQVESE